MVRAPSTSPHGDHHMLTVELKEHFTVVEDAIRALNAEPSQDNAACKVCWEGSVYYPDQVDGWHPMAEYNMTHQGAAGDGAWHGSASAPTYRPAWLHDFNVVASAATPVELFRALERQVDAEWRRQDDAHRAAQASAAPAPQQ